MIIRYFNKFDKYLTLTIMQRALLLILVFCAVKANAQNYLIQFSGSGASSSLSSVKIENLTKGTNLTINGSDVLRLTLLTGANSIEDDHLSVMKIYPNPMIDNTTIEILPPVAGDAVITILNMIGKPVVTIQNYLEKFRSGYRISGLKTGFYIVNVKGKNYKFSGKLLSNGKPDGIPGIEKINFNIQAIYEKEIKKDSKGIQATVDMPYSNGERLKITGSSGNFSTIVMDVPTVSKTITFEFVACTDGDNKSYPVFNTGIQVWMAANLKSARYLNGDLIGTTTTPNSDIRSESTPKYQWSWNGVESNADIYGRLYTWFALNDSRRICPAGWHLPDETDCTALTDYLGGMSLSGGKLKETGYTHWQSPNTGATNETGFTGLPGGYRVNSGVFAGSGTDGLWWSSTEGNVNDAWAFGMGNSYADAYGGLDNKRSGASARCILGEPGLPAITTAAISNVTSATATSGGNITSDGGSPVIARGVCWATTANPTILNSATTNGTGTGVFISNLTGLTAGTLYYVRAYATSSAGTAYGNQIVFTSLHETGTLSDNDGNTYSTVRIGTQWWMMENLKTTRLNDNTPIPNITDNTPWSTLSTPAYSWYDNDPSTYKTVYGAFYNWFAVNTGNLCPTGWHVPTDTEFNTLELYLGISPTVIDTYGWRGTDQGAQMKNTSGWAAGENGTNTSGFSALPGGYRYGVDGSFKAIGILSYWWTDSPDVVPNSWYRRLDGTSNQVYKGTTDKVAGKYVRCLKN
jgi:uncharacterized protein (TIGR02145 family)